MKHHFLASIVVTLLLGPTRALGQTAVRIEVRHDLILLPVNVDGRRFDFLMDTGSAGSAIDLDTARTLGLTAKGKERVEKNFRELIVDVVEIAVFSIGNLAFSNVKFDELNLAPLTGAVGAKVDGVLGNDVLERMVFRLNYSKQELLLESSPSLRSTGTVVPLRRRNGQFLISTTLISEPVDLVLDTGTNLTSLSWRSWERVMRTWKPTTLVEGIARAGNPTSPAILVCLPEIRFGHEVVRNRAVRAQTKSDEGAFASEDFEGILGDELLRQFEITFDLGHDRVFLRRDSAYRPDPYKYVTIGVQFGKDEQGFYRIVSVWKNSPAAEAGLQEGDKLTAINGQPTDTLTLEGISKRLHAKAGTPIELTTQRDQRRLILTVRTRELLCKQGAR